MGGAEGIGVSNLPKALYSKIALDGCAFNIMIMGSHGLGKTTLLNCILGCPVLKPQPFAEGGSNRFWYMQDICNIQVSRVTAKALNFSTHLSIIEIDGIGDNVNNTNCYVPAIEFLEHGFEDYEAKFKDNVRALIEDTRVHLCLYMLEPLETIRKPDIEALKAVSKYCNVIPIVAKADLLEEHQAAAVKKSIRDQLDMHGVSPYEDRRNGFETPFFVIADAVTERGRERTHRWGSFDTLGAATNELAKLKEFIVERSMLSLRDETELFYDNYRTTKLASYLVEAGKGDESKSLLHRLEEYRHEIRDIKERIKSKRQAKESSCLPTD